jgi:hypothetical protein
LHGLHGLGQARRSRSPAIGQQLVDLQQRRLCAMPVQQPALFGLGPQRQLLCPAPVLQLAQLGIAASQRPRPLAHGAQRSPVLVRQSFLFSQQLLQAWRIARQIGDQSLAPPEHLVVQAFNQKGAIGRQAQHREPAQRMNQPVDGLLSRWRMDDQLAQHGVVIGRDFAAGVQCVVKAQRRAAEDGSLGGEKCRTTPVWG